MRLQLTVQRHGLPPTQILWTVGAAAKPPNVALATTITICQFLEQVNEIIPLEADEWGLEDYAVEVRGFECLHFSELSQVLREDDEVCIRPLQTSDLRVRKFSGRHQIAADGKHLIDGVAFGRPFLKRADRPTVRIPPRKRRRILPGEEDESLLDLEDDDKQIAVRAGFDDIEGDDEDESEDDEDFDPDAADDEGLEDELEGLQEDLRPGEEGIDDTARGPRRRSRRKSVGLGLDFLGGGLYSNPLLDLYSQDEPSVGSSTLKVGKRRSKDERKASNSKYPKPALSPRRLNRANSTGSNKSVRFKDSELMTPAAVLEVEDDDDDEDEDDDEDDDFHPAGLDGSTDVDESDKENTEPAIDDTNSLDTSDSSSSSFSDFNASEEDTEDEDETSSSGISSSDSDSDSSSSPDQLSSNPRDTARVNKHSSGPSTTSSGQSNFDEGNRDKKRKSVADEKSPNTMIRGLVTEPKKRLIENILVPHGAGKQSTRMRNMRRKASLALKIHKERGDIPMDATTVDLINFKEQMGDAVPRWMQDLRSKLDSVATEKANSGRNARDDEKTDPMLPTAFHWPGGASANLRDSHVDKPASQNVSPSLEVQEKKQPQGGEISGPGASENVEKDWDPNVVQVPDSMPEYSKPAPVRYVSSQLADVPLPPFTPPDPSDIPASVFPLSQNRRSRLDIASSKRLLFGSLGLKAPKTKDEETALRAKLMKDVKPIKPARERVAEIGIVEAAAVSAENDDNDDSWKDKIELAAVECCHDGIELSTPPFPFVQRWDPQQRGTYSKKKGKKNKKRKRTDQSYYEDNYKESSTAGSPSKVARWENYDANLEQPQFDADTFKHDHTEQHHEASRDRSLRDSVAANEQLLRENSESAAHAVTRSQQQTVTEGLPDLPGLPDDLTVFEELKKQTCVAGAVIAFKKFLMSAETNWQPRISSYLTAAVRELHEDGTLLMSLARRDQPKDAVRYHEETGERLYSKFEMPGYDDEDIDRDKSSLEIPFDELINPRLIQLPNVQNASEDASGPITSNPQDTLEIPIGDEAQRATTEPQAAISFDSNIENPIRFDNEITPPTDSARREIVEMIQDAGWRSSLGSGIGKGLEVSGDATSSRPESHNVANPSTVHSPTFEEFDSSPHVNGSHDASSPLPDEVSTSKTQKVPEVNGTHVKPSEKDGSYELPASVEYPVLPDSNEESELFQHQRQHRSVSLVNDLQSPEADFVSPPSIRRGGGRSSPSLTSSPPSQRRTQGALECTSTLDGANDSSDEFPELFSQAFEARMSQEPIIKDESSPKYDIRRLPKAMEKPRTSRNIDSGSWKTELSGFDEEADKDSSFRPSQSQVTQSSQIVDLTISSDLLEPTSDESEGVSTYRSSSGWVNKPKADQDIGVKRKSAKRKTRSQFAIAH